MTYNPILYYLSELTVIMKVQFSVQCGTATACKIVPFHLTQRFLLRLLVSGKHLVQALPSVFVPN